jgi:hypothetical protein
MHVRAVGGIETKKTIDIIELFGNPRIVAEAPKLVFDPRIHQAQLPR